MTKLLLKYIASLALVVAAAYAITFGGRFDYFCGSSPESIRQAAKTELLCAEPMRRGLLLTFFDMPLILPVGIVVHGFYWFSLLKREEDVRAAALPREGSSPPRRFYPSPVAEWIAGSGTIFFASWFFILADAAANGGLSTTLACGVVLLSVLAAPIAALYTGANVLNLRVEPDGISFARGRTDLQWTRVPWSDVLWEEKKRREEDSITRCWIEITLKSSLNTLTIKEEGIVDYPILRNLLRLAAR